MRRLSLLVLLLALACGDEEPIVHRAPAPSAAVRAPVAASPDVDSARTVHEVRMVEEPPGSFRFDPPELTIKVGDTVRWINVSGFPHNVAFYADRIPFGAAEVLETLMPAEGMLGPLNSRLMTDAGDIYEITFLNVPTGTYEYFCVVHEALDQVATLTVER